MRVEQESQVRRDLWVPLGHRAIAASPVHLVPRDNVDNKVL